MVAMLILGVSKHCKNLLRVYGAGGRADAWLHASLIASETRGKGEFLLWEPVCQCSKCRVQRMPEQERLASSLCPKTKSSAYH